VLPETVFVVKKVEVKLMKGDITEVETEAIVNAANPTLMGGGGVDGAIHRKGGPKIREECLAIRRNKWPEGLPTGEAVITSGGNLKAKFVIHTVGPVWRGGKYGEAKALATAYLNCLKLAEKTGLSSVAFPSISTGAYGFPVEQASYTALKTVKDYIGDNGKLKQVVFVLFSDRDYELYATVARRLFQQDACGQST
jgi:O-acetyl-ADP-ribose deacetylase (regulator of RNase III)